MSPHTPIRTGFEELTSRDSDGIHVTLLWNRANNDTVVAVFDASTDAAFELEVADNPPLDVFNHPYAYAAFHHIDPENAHERLAAEAITA
jgi:hypothetical protein